MKLLNLKEQIQNEKVNPLVRDFQLSYLNDRKVDIFSMITYLLEEQLDQFFDLAHQWIGTGEPYGFHFLTQLGREIERHTEHKEKNINELHRLINIAQYYLELKKEHV